MNERFSSGGSLWRAVGVILFGFGFLVSAVAAQTPTEAGKPSTVEASTSRAAPNASSTAAESPSDSSSNTPQNKEPFVLVINAKNPILDLDRSRISKMFLKKIKRWPDKEKTPVEPIDQTEDSTIREAFTRAIHNKDLFAIKTYWQRMIFSGRMAPPPELRSDAEVLSFVRSRRGAIGYVRSDTDLGEGVTVLKVIQDEK